jgi:glyoxylase-like metal-dependent hydrolase (beta-lactamase superfamily II)
MKWLIGLAVVVAALAGFAWYFVLDGAAPARAEGEIDVAAYRALVADDPPELLPREVRIEFVGESRAPSFAAMAGAFDGQRTFSYNSFQVVAPSGNIIIDGAVDRETLNGMSDGQGSFDEGSYQRVLGAMSQAAHIMITHEHLDHVIAIARHPAPAVIAPRLSLTRTQLDGLAPHGPGGRLPPEFSAVEPADFSSPQRIAPGVVADAAPGHSPGTILIYVRSASREYLFIGDIAWVMDSVERARGRPRLIRWIVPGVDPDRPAVLRQLRALHDITVREPQLVIVPAHDDAYLRNELIAGGGLIEGFSEPLAEMSAQTQ